MSNSATMMLEQPLTREDVIASYRLFFGRDPESEAIVDGHVNHHKTLGAYRTACMTSGEFRHHAGQMPYFTRDKWVRTEIRHGLHLWVNLRDNVVSRACLDEGWEPAVTDLVLRNLAKGDSFIDIGANIGWFTVLAAHRFRELGGGCVHAFEPRSDIFRMLARSVADNGLEPFVRLHNAALADRAGTMELFWYADNENAAASALAARGRPAGSRGETVRLMRLDDVAIAGPVRFIKSDAEGAEGLVFAGAERLLSTWHPTVAAELNVSGLPAVSGISADDFLQTMFARGYGCRLLEEDGTVERAITRAAQTGDEAANVVFS